MIHEVQLPMGNASEATREPSSHVTSETRLNWVQNGRDAKGYGHARSPSCKVTIRAVAIHSASGGQWHPPGSVTWQTGTWDAPSRSHTGEKAYAHPHA